MRLILPLLIHKNPFLVKLRPYGVKGSADLYIHNSQSSLINDATNKSTERAKEDSIFDFDAKRAR